MTNTGITDLDAFFRMASEFPLRTSIFTFALPVFALLQLLNGYLNGGSLVFIGGFVVVAFACSILLTQYELAVYRRERLARRWL